MKELSLNECHGRLIKIANLFHIICENNNIPYYMIGGTMLGAIRHKGFIPWDDDMDFGVPRKYFDLLIDALEKGIHSPYRVISYKTANYPLSFIKIEDTKTWIDDPQRRGHNDLRIGINIDIFPLEECSLDSNKVNPYIKRKQLDTLLISAYYLSFVHESWQTRLFHKIVHILFKNKSVDYWLERDRKFIEKVNNTGDEAYINFFGIYCDRGIINRIYYGSPKLYQFEDSSFYGVEQYDVILKQIYGNYMELPPENKRRNHSNKIYELD
ncbi:LicD family protein [Prevotella communis]|uniref:LicD family protein n=1 Tax=Prevotella communis TaxID=2913614 RepID=UPI001EDC1338|nr:LicD family protein [Prevotella communis]UKK62347.1 LicD family protein [Prevotella communis]UKK65174.1 LicD family protein [Prevotella communis]